MVSADLRNKKMLPLLIFPKKFSQLRISCKPPSAILRVYVSSPLNMVGGRLGRHVGRVGGLQRWLHRGPGLPATRTALGALMLMLVADHPTALASKVGTGSTHPTPTVIKSDDIRSSGSNCGVAVPTARARPYTPCPAAAHVGPRRR